MLLFTRKRILEREFSVSTCSSLVRLGELLAENPPQVIVLCHTVSEWECEQVIELSRISSPDVKILKLEEGKPLGECSDLSDTTMECLDGPVLLLHKVRDLLGEASAEHSALA
jgi:hypothetical protein